MLFVNWRSVELLSISLGCVLLSVIVMWFVRMKSWKIKVPIIVVGMLTFVPGTAFTLLFWLFITVDWNHHSVAQYSPNGKAAARIEYWGGFGNTGGSCVILRTKRGFWIKTVFRTDADITPKQLVWKGNENLTIYYPREAAYAECFSPSSVRVTCIAEDVTYTRTGTSVWTGVLKARR